MICAALHGATCEQLKRLNDTIIVQGAKPWELGLPDWKPADHIDIMEVAPGMGAQKVYAGRIHCKNPCAISLFAQSIPDARGDAASVRLLRQ